MQTHASVETLRYEKTFNLVLVGIFSIDNLKVNGNAATDVQRNKYWICFVCFLNFSGATKNLKMTFMLNILSLHGRLNETSVKFYWKCHAQEVPPLQGFE